MVAVTVVTDVSVSVVVDVVLIVVVTVVVVDAWGGVSVIVELSVRVVVEVTTGVGAVIVLVLLHVLVRTDVVTTATTPTHFTDWGYTAGLQTSFPFFTPSLVMAFVFRSSRASSLAFWAAESAARRFREPGTVVSTGTKPAEAAIVVVSVDVTETETVDVEIEVVVAVSTSVDVTLSVDVTVSVSTGRVIVDSMVVVEKTISVDAAGVTVVDGV